MIFDRALLRAKRTDSERVGLNIKIPVELKNEFDKVCRKHGISMTSMMLSLIETAIDESNGKYESRELELKRLLNMRIDYLNKRIKDFESDFDPEYFNDYRDNQAEKMRLESMREELS